VDRPGGPLRAAQPDWLSRVSAPAAQSWAAGRRGPADAAASAGRSLDLRRTVDLGDGY